MIKTLVCVGSLCGLAACSLDPRAWETAPVMVDSPQGAVTCQLYTKELVSWDRSIDHPANMSTGTADAYCRAEGKRLQSS